MKVRKAPKSDRYAEVDAMLKSRDWGDVRVDHFVPLYKRMHRKAYGVDPTDLGQRAEEAAAACATTEFGGDLFAMLAFKQWLWSREIGREKWRRENGKSGGHLGWRYAFSSGAVTEYRVAMNRQGKPIPAPEREEEDDAPESETKPSTSFALTDLGNAKRFVARHGRDLRYTPSHGWLTWDGKRWAKNETGEVERRAKETVCSMLIDAARLTDDSKRAELTRHAIKSQQASRIAAMMSLAKTEPEVATTIDAFDVDPMLLNTQSGTVDLRTSDLRTSELRPHDRADLITKITAAEYDANARSDLWERVLLESQGGDEVMVSFIQRALGYATTGSTAEEKLFMPIGPTRSGKSTLFFAMRNALGDYATVADFETFVAKKGDSGPRNDIARLRGARLVLSSEVEDGKRLAEGLVKSLTGGDAITARFLYSEAFELKPQFKLVLVANEAPKVNDQDDAIWARIERLPFEHTVPPEKRDPKVKAELHDVAKSGPAILAWLVKGALEWQRIGLAVPERVTAATEEYRESQDPLVDFFAEECRFGPDLWTSREKILARYESWRKESGGRFPLTPRTMADRLRKRGLRDEGPGAKRHGVRGWIGIGLVDHKAEADDADVPPIARPWPTMQEIRLGKRSSNVEKDEKLRAERRRRRREAAVNPAQAALDGVGDAESGALEGPGGTSNPCFSGAGALEHPFPEKSPMRANMKKESGEGLKVPPVPRAEGTNGGTYGTYGSAEADDDRIF